MSNICARARVYLVVTTFLSWAWRAMAVAAPMMLANAGQARASGYDPLAVDAAARPTHLDLTVHDAAREPRYSAARLSAHEHRAGAGDIVQPRPGRLAHGQRVSRRALGGARLHGGLPPASRQRRVGVEGQARAGADAGDETGGLAGEFSAARAGRSRRAEPARSLERRQDPSSRRPAGLEESRDVRPFLRRGDDGGRER